LSATSKSGKLDQETQAALSHLIALARREAHRAQGADAEVKLLVRHGCTRTRHVNLVQ